MQQLDAIDTALPLPIWAAAALLVLFIALAIAALRRSATAGSVTALFGIPALLIIAWAAWTSVDQSMHAQHAIQRQALDARATQLSAAASAPGSALACLDALAGAEVEAACERAIFAAPQTVAAAAAYVEARLRLLADGMDYTRDVDRGYQPALTGLRRALEIDRFGFVAYVLANRGGCTPQQCLAFALLRDASTVKANLQARTYENTVARHAAGWIERAGAANAVGALKSSEAAPPVANPVDFPGTVSLPPAGAMNSESAAESAVPAGPPQ